MSVSILIVDDEKVIRRSLEEALIMEGYDIFTASSGKEAMSIVKNHMPDLMLIDLRLPDGDGLSFMTEATRIAKDLGVIVITGYGNVETAVQAMKLGAFDYLNKPLNLEEMKVIVQKAFETLSLKKEVHHLRNQLLGKFEIENIKGESPKIKEICSIIRKVACSKATTVLIRGESGTGKELVARAIHSLSDRRDHPFMEINCTALPETLLESELFGHEKGAFTDAKQEKKGLFELADRGTIFLDEIGDMSNMMQAKLLRALQDKSFTRVGGTKRIQVDVRIIASTNKNLEKGIEDGDFREDLYYRLKVVPIHLPALRERGDDILLLASYFRNEFNIEFSKQVKSVSKEAEQKLLQYSWPGNVRELKNVIERAILLESEEVILPDHLILTPIRTEKNEEGKIVLNLDELSVEEAEKRLIEKVMKETNGNKNVAAKVLKINRTTLYSKIRKYQIEDVEKIHMV